LFGGWSVFGEKRMFWHIFKNLIIIITGFIPAVKMIFCAGCVFLPLADIDPRSNWCSNWRYGFVRRFQENKKTVEIQAVSR